MLSTKVHSNMMIVLVLGLSTLFRATGTDNITTMEQSYASLKNEIFNRPVIKHKLPLEVSEQKNIVIEFIPFQILSVDEIRQVVSLSALTILMWRFYQLDWNPDDYNNISFLYVDSDTIWTPRISLPKEDGEPTLKIPSVTTLAPTTFSTLIPMSVSTTCKLDLSDFPFDSHNCSIIFIEPQRYNLVPSAFPLSQFSLLREDFITSTEWVFLDSAYMAILAEHNVYYTQCWFTMERRSLFYILGVFVPILHHDTLCLRHTRGIREKISFIVSIFVSMTIFISYINNIIPRSMDRIPRIVLLLGAILLNTVLSMLASFLVINRYYADQNHREKHAKENVQAKNQINGIKSTAWPVTELFVEGGISDSTMQTESESGNSKPKTLFYPANAKDSFDREETANKDISRSQPKGYWKSNYTMSTICNCCPYLTHSRLDTMFLLLFMVTSVGTYWYILSF